MVKIKKKRLGDILIGAGAITTAQMVDTIEYQKREKVRFGEALVALNLISEEKLVSTLATQLNLEVASLESITPDFSLLNRVTEQAARKFSVFPVSDDGRSIRLAMRDPLDIFAIDFVSIKLNREVTPLIAKGEQIENAITRHYGVSSSINNAIQSVKIADVALEKGSGTAQTAGGGHPHGEMAPMATLFDTIIRQSVHSRASDIHIEPDDDKVCVRDRVDGILFNASIVPKVLQSALTGTIKVTSHMDIAESRTPQDGRFSKIIDGKEMEFRVSSFPTIYGENIVIRILREDATRGSINDTGMTGKSLDDFMKMLDSPFGAILVTGPTGSGKTSTLYAALKHLNTVDKNIITVEDPVEYRLEGIRQTQVNMKAGLDFAKSMRAILRQDPDIIMIGEIRDSETAGVAVEAAMTGHLVLSTLHTNDAASAVMRLSDLGVEPFMISSAVLGVVAQRLVRRICPHCKVRVQPSEAERIYPGWAQGAPMYQGSGCQECKKTGYSGRTGIYEVLSMDETARILVGDRVHPSALKEHCVRNNAMETMAGDGLGKVKMGITTVREVKRVMGTI